MDRKRRRSNQASSTDIPREITNRASSAFTNYLNRAKRSRTSTPPVNEDTPLPPEPSADTITQSITINIDQQAPLAQNHNIQSTHTPEQYPYPYHDGSDDDDSDNDLQQTGTLLYPTDTAGTHEDDLDDPDEQDPTNTVIQDPQQSNEIIQAGPAGAIDNSDVISTLLKHMNKGFKYSASWASMLSFLSVTGRTRFPKQHYKVLQDTVHTLTESAESMPSYTSTRDTQNRFFTDFCFPKSEIHYVQCDILPNTLARNIRTVSTNEGEQRDARECVKIVTASSWAKFDFSLLSSYSDIIDGDHHLNKEELSIERSELVADREHFIGSSCSFWALHEGSIVNVDVGTSIHVPITHSSSADNNYCPLDFGKEKEDCFLKCRTGPQWCVTSPNYVSPRLTTVNTSALSADEKFLYHSLKSSTLSLDIPDPTKKKKKKTIPIKEKNPAVATADAAEILSIYPTDVCVFLRPISDNKKMEGNVICILVSSFVSNITELASERLIWVRVEKQPSITAVSNNDLPRTDQITIQSLRTVTIKDIPTVSKSNKVPIQAEKQRFSNPKGKLEDGTDFIIYRFALYADEFGHNGTCGVYILLLGASQHNRISSAGVRVLTLVPKHQNVNAILNIILDDILRGMVHGFDCVDPFGKKVRAFMDMCSAFGDYVKITAITNTAGHSATCFCSYCRVSKSSANTGPTYSASTLTHCRRMSFMRFDERLDILTNMAISDDTRKLVGLKTTDSIESSKLPLVRFSNKLVASKHRIRKTDTGSPVVSGYFDSCLSTAVAPDHLLSGLITVLLEACFKSLPNNVTRKSLQNFIMQTAVDNSLATEGPFLKYSGTTFEGLNSMTMSTSYTIFLIASRYFEDLKNTDLDTQKIFHIPSYLQEFISTLYYWPDLSIDHDEDVLFYKENNGVDYFDRLRRYAFAYNKAVATAMNRNGVDTILKDRPNSHRLLELSLHTLPLFGHGKLFSELVLELAHTYFKGWFRSNTHSNSHITGIDLFLTRIWSSNVFLTYHMWRNGTESQMAMAFRHLFRLFFGEEALNTYTTFDQDPQLQDNITRFKSHLDTMMRQPVRRLLLGSIPIAFAAEKIEWKPRYKLRQPYDEFTLKAFQILSPILGASIIGLKENSVLFERAALTTYGKFNIGTRTYPYKTIFRGTPICYHVHESDKTSKFLNYLTNGHGERIHSIVQSIFVHNKITYITVNDLIEYPRNMRYDIYKIDTNSLRVIRLQHGIVRLGYVYSGIKSVLEATNTNIAAHEGNSLLNGHRCGLLFRLNGYPPCLG